MSKPSKSLDRHEARSYLLGVRQNKSWVGEEVLFMTEEKPFLYTATCQTAIKALTMSRMEMFETLGRLYPTYLNTLLKRS